MERLEMIMDAADPIFAIYHEDGLRTFGLPDSETEPFRDLLNSVTKRYNVNTICGEYYETLGFETQQDKDELIADALKLFEEVKKHLSDKYIIFDEPDLSQVYNTPAGQREELRRAYEEKVKASIAKFYSDRSPK